MAQRFSGLIAKIKNQFLEYETHPSQYFVFGILGILQSIIPYFLIDYNYSNSLWFQYFSLVTILLSFLILFKKELSPFLKSKFSYIWHIFAFLCFPLQGAIMFISNAYSVEWALYFSSSLIILCALVNALMYTLILITTYIFSICVWFSLFYVSKENSPSLAIVINYTYFYFIVILISVLWNSKLESIRQDRMSLGYKVAGYTAHEIRSVIGFFYGVVSGLERILSFKKIKNSMPKSDYDFFKTMPAEITNICSKTSFLIDILLVKIKNNNLSQNTTKFKISECVTSSTENYRKYMNIGHIELNIIIKQDFYLIANFALFQHVLYNLLNNAKEALYKSRAAKIEIIIEKKNNSNFLRVQDNACLLNEDNIDKVFSFLYSRSSEGIGLGLSFCKEVVNEVGGEMSCLVKKGKYTEFNIVFPTINGKSIEG